MIVDNGGPNVQVDEAVLFPFDDRSIPFRYRLEVGLVAQTNPYKPHQIVLGKGGPEDPDGLNIQFYGTVIRVGNELRMWYIGKGDDSGKIGGRICYAVSKDGVNWEKPKLGLVEFNSSTQNNLVQYSSEHSAGITAILVLYDPDDNDPNRRFKMINETSPFYNIAAFSPDGLHWKESPHNPILKHNAIEPGGLMKFNGSYYLTGQGGNVGSKRALVTYVSYDFDHWTDAVSVGLRRDRPPYQQISGPHAGEQVHLGASLWNRGNVILGLYGIWHGESNDRSYVSMDLGFVVSNDGIHYTEPIPDFQMISAYDIMTSERRRTGEMVPAPCLEQGQGFENIRNETLTWYSPWRGGFVCVARWPRDRLGYFEVVRDPKPRLLMPEDTHTMFWAEHKEIPIEKTDPHFISCPIHLDRPDARLFINAEELSQQSSLKVEVLDERFRPVAGFSGDDCIPLKESGLRQSVAWQGKRSLENLDHPIRIKVSFQGVRPEDAEVYAVYVSHEGE